MSEPINIKYILFIKLLRGRGSAGIDEENPIHKHNQLGKIVENLIEGIRQPALIEEYIESRELTGGIIDYKNPELLPLLEIKYNSALANIYEIKIFDKEMGENIKRITITAYETLNGKDFGRVDTIWIKIIYLIF